MVSEWGISKCLNNPFPFLKQFCFASFSDLQCYARDQLYCWGKCIQKVSQSGDHQVLIQPISSYKMNSYISLAGFSNLQCVVYTSIYVAFLK